MAALLMTTACESIDSTSAEEQDQDLAESESALRRWIGFGPIELNENPKADLKGGDLGHYYTFQAMADETVTFNVEWRLPEAKSLGAKLVLTSANGRKTLARAVEAKSNIARLTYTFAKGGTYRVYVSHYGYALFGKYPYVLSAFDRMCALWQGTWADPLYNPETDNYEDYHSLFFSAANYGPVNEDGYDPWAFNPYWDQGFVTTEHTVAMGRTCGELHDENCGTDGPVGGIGYVEFPVGYGAVLPNVCEVRNHVFEMAGDEDNWFVWYDDCANHQALCESILGTETEQ